MSDYLNAFLQTKRSEHTRRNYESVISMTEKEFGICVEDMTEEDVFAIYKLWQGMVHGKRLSNTTFKFRVSALRSFSFFLEEKMDDYTSPFRGLALPKVSDNVQLIRTPSLSECDMLLSRLSVDSDEFLIFAFALRIAASSDLLRRMRKERFVDHGDALYYHDVAKDTDRMVAIPSDLHGIVRRKLLTSADYLFVSRKGTPYAERSMRDKIAKVLEREGLSQYSLGDFRNRCIIEMLASGTPAENIAQYVDVTQERLTYFKSAVDGSVNAPCEMSRIRIVTA